MNLHPTVPVAYRDGRLDVDVEVAPVLEKLWALGIDTCGSCQGWPSPVPRSPSAWGSRAGEESYTGLAIICFTEPVIDYVSLGRLEGDEDEDDTGPSWAKWHEASDAMLAAKSGAERLAEILAQAAPTGPERWRWEKSWRWEWRDTLNGGSALLLPNEDLGWLDGLLAADHFHGCEDLSRGMSVRAGQSKS